MSFLTAMVIRSDLGELDGITRIVFRFEPTEG